MYLKPSGKSLVSVIDIHTFFPLDRAEESRPVWRRGCKEALSCFTAIPTGAWELSPEEVCPRQAGLPNTWDPQTRGEAAPHPCASTPSPGMWETEVPSKPLLCQLTWAGQSPRSTLHPVSSHRFHHTGCITQASAGMMDKKPSPLKALMSTPGKSQ